MMRHIEKMKNRDGVGLSLVFELAKCFQCYHETPAANVVYEFDQAMYEIGASQTLHYQVHICTNCSMHSVQIVADYQKQYATAYIDNIDIIKKYLEVTGSGVLSSLPSPSRTKLKSV